MSTISLETARKLKSAFDAPGLVPPQGIERLWFEYSDGYHCLCDAATGAVLWASDTRVSVQASTYVDNYLAPDAEELGEWLPENLDEWREISCESWNPYTFMYVDVSGCSHTNLFGKGDTLAEALAALLMACIEADAGQIKRHLEKLWRSM